VDDGLRLELATPIRTGFQYPARPARASVHRNSSSTTLIVTVPEPGPDSSSTTVMRLAGFRSWRGTTVLESTPESSVFVCGFNYRKHPHPACVSPVIIHACYVYPYDHTESIMLIAA
jgi:hypothetical protein